MKRVLRFAPMLVLAVLAVAMAMCLVQPADTVGATRPTDKPTQANPGSDKKATKAASTPAPVSTAAPASTVAPASTEAPANPLVPAGPPDPSSDDSKGQNGSDKVAVCHVPPGNPAAAHVVTVDANGWEHGHNPIKHSGQGHELDFLVDASHPCPPKAEVITGTPNPSTTPTATATGTAVPGTPNPTEGPSDPEETDVPDQPGTQTPTDPVSTGTPVPGCPVTVIVVTATPTATPGCVPPPPPCSAPSANPTASSFGNWIDRIIAGIAKLADRFVTVLEKNAATRQLEASVQATQTSLEVQKLQPAAVYLPTEQPYR